MRFDPERATAFLRTLDFPRFAGTVGERRAAELVAEGFRKAGLRVERWELPRRPSPPIAVLAPVSGALGALISGLAIRGGPWGWRVGGPLIGFVSLFAATYVRLRTDRNSFVHHMQDVIGEPPDGASAPSRVVFQAHLDTQPSRGVVSWRRLLTGLTTCCAGPLIAQGIFADGRLSLATRLTLLAGFWISSTLRIVVPWGRLRTGAIRDDRSGLAVLVELARTWPSRGRGRIEARFAATGGGANGEAGAREMARRAGGWSSKPTFIISLDRPGNGSRLALIGRDPALQLAEDAARDLWLPHRVSPLASLLESRPFDRLGWASVRLRGEGRSNPVDPAALGAAAQLAAEIALRWARMSAGDQGESRARSSQKPG